MKVLLVDDVNFTLEIAKMAVADMATEILTATNGREALEVLMSNPPDMILMDLFMPEMNGDECCQLIKSEPAWKDIPVLMITAVDDPENKERCFNAGCNDIIKKPFTKELVVQKMLEHKRA